MLKMGVDFDKEESRLSQLLFNKTKDLVEKLKPDEINDLDEEREPAWLDDDDNQHDQNITNVKNNHNRFSQQLKRKYETLVGTPNWAKLSRKLKPEDEDSHLLRTVGHLHKKQSVGLPTKNLYLKIFPKINSATLKEGPIISSVEFHPKASVAMVAGQAAIVSLFSIGGDVNDKLHSFQMKKKGKKWRVGSACFNPNGSEAYISSKFDQNYCVYDLIKAEPKYVQLPQVIKAPKIFKMSPNGKLFAICDGLEEIFLICSASKELLHSLKQNGIIASIAFSHDSEQLYSYGVDGEVIIWDLSMYRAVKKFQDSGCVKGSRITTSPCGKLLATGSREGIVNIYETGKLTTSEPLPIKTISNLRTKITGLNFNPTSEILAMSSWELPNAVKLVHIPSYSVFANFPNRNYILNKVQTISFSPNSGYMALGNDKASAYLYRLSYYKNY